MVRINNTSRAFLVALGLLLLVSGCGLNAKRTHPEFDLKADSIKYPVLVPPDVNMFDLSSGGVAVLRDDWSRIGRANLQTAIRQNLEEKQYTLKLMQTTRQTAEHMDEVWALYELVHKTMNRRTFGSHKMSDETKGFAYSLGSLEEILKDQAGDAMIFVTGYDQVFENGRKALIDLAIADSSGTILYYSVKGTIEGKDLRDPTNAVELVRDLLSGFAGTQG